MNATIIKVSNDPAAEAVASFARLYGFDVQAIRIESIDADFVPYAVHLSIPKGGQVLLTWYHPHREVAGALLVQGENRPEFWRPFVDAYEENSGTVAIYHQ